MAIYMAEGHCTYHRTDVGSVQSDQREHNVEIVARCSENLGNEQPSTSYTLNTISAYTLLV